MGFWPIPSPHQDMHLVVPQTWKPGSSFSIKEARFLDPLCVTPRRL